MTPTVSARGGPGGDVMLTGAVHLRWRTFTELLEPGRGLCLDLGCGGGGHQAALEAHGYRYVGVDLRTTDAVTVVADAHALPFADGSVDLVVSAQVLEHLRDPAWAVREATRVLRRGGVFCGSTSLLEPFHDSYFNFTHWGLTALLAEAGGLKRVRIEAGPNVALFIVYYFFDMLGALGLGRRASVVLARVVFAGPFVALWLGHVVKAAVKALLGRTSGLGRRELWSRHALSWAGYLLFRGEKS